VIQFFSWYWYFSFSAWYNQHTWFIKTWYNNFTSSS